MIQRYRHAQLLVMLVALLLLNPFLHRIVGFVVIDLVLLFTMASAVIACADRRSHAIAGVAMALLVLATSWYRDFTGIQGIDAAYSVLGLVFFVYVTVMVLGDVFRTRRAVSLDTICGGLAGYLLLGLAWAFAYALEESLNPGSFSGMRDAGYASGYQRYLGYSFVTLTTLGYGNVVPTNAQSEALASAEAIVGQIYLTVLVARLVALNLIFEQAKGDDAPGQKQT